MTALVEFEHVTKQYGNQKALNDVSFVIEPGKIYGLLGPNGSGKSTTIKIINDLLQPTSGTVLVNGKAPGVESKKIISYLPDRNYLSDWMKVEDTFKLFCDFTPILIPSERRKCCVACHIDSKARIKIIIKRYAGEGAAYFDYGRRAQLYVLDEPIAGVDPGGPAIIFCKLFSAIMVRKAPF